jgi:hypothetical protein
MKEQLIEQLTAALQSEDIMSVRDAVRGIRNQWKSETVKERQLQLEAFKASEPEQAIEFIYVPHEKEGMFQDLCKQYEDRIEEAGKILAAERQKNFDAKMLVIADFQKLIQEEENVGKAFVWHKELRERWDNIGDVPGDKYHEVQENWQRLNHAFFYNINIYKELQAHDLKVNQKSKEALIEEAKTLASIESINDLEMMVKKLQREFVNIGPSPKETYKETGDTFFGILREAQLRIQAHYDAIQQEADANLAIKQALIVKTKEILAMDFTQPNAWNKWTDEIIKLQEEWKNVGWTRKKDNEETWLEFRGLCDAFFAKRNAYFEERKSVQKENHKKKEEIIAKAKSIQESNEWKKTTEELKKLQEQWRGVGNAEPKDENKLWQRFRAACDHFFNRKKEHFDGMSGQQEENLRLKLALLEEAEGYALTGNKGADLGFLKNLSDRWKGIGHVPKENVTEVSKRYNDALDKLYGGVNANRQEKNITQYKSRVENLKSQGSGSVIKRERSLLQDKIDRLNIQIKQYENNMGIFTGKGAEALRKEIEKKIKSCQTEIMDIKDKMKLLVEENQ